MGLLDFRVDVVLARLEADFSDQPPSIPAVPNRKVSLQCPTTKYPCSAQPMSIPAMLNGCAQPQSIPAVLNHQVSLQCPTAKYPCGAQPQSIPAVPNHQVSLQCPTTTYPCSAQPQSFSCSAQPQSILTLPNRKVSLPCSTTKYPRSAQPQSIPTMPNCKVSLRCPTAQPKSIPAVPKHKVSLECPTVEYQYSCSAFAVLQGRQLRGGRETLHFLCNNGFRVGMLEGNNLCICLRASLKEPACVVGVAVRFPGGCFPRRCCGCCRYCGCGLCRSSCCF